MTSSPALSQRTPAARVQNLTKTYGSGQALVRALDDRVVERASGTPA